MKAVATQEPATRKILPLASFVRSLRFLAPPLLRGLARCRRRRITCAQGSNSGWRKLDFSCVHRASTREGSCPHQLSSNLSATDTEAASFIDRLSDNFEAIFRITISAGGCGTLQKTASKGIMCSHIAECGAETRAEKTIEETCLACSQNEKPRQLELSSQIEELLSALGFIRLRASIFNRKPHQRPSLLVNAGAADLGCLAAEAAEPLPSLKG